MMNYDSRYKWLSEMGDLIFQTEVSSYESVLKNLSDRGNPFAMYNYAYSIKETEPELAYSLFEDGEYAGNQRCIEALSRILWDWGEYASALNRHLLLVRSDDVLPNTVLRSKLTLGSDAVDRNDFEVFLKHIEMKTSENDAAALYVLAYIYGSKYFWGRPSDFEIDLDNAVRYLIESVRFGMEYAENDIKKINESPEEFGRVCYEYDDYFGDSEIGHIRFVLE